MSFPHEFNGGDTLYADDMNEIEAEIQTKLTKQTDASSIADVFAANNASAGVYTISISDGDVQQGYLPITNNVSSSLAFPITSKAVAIALEDIDDTIEDLDRDLSDLIVQRVPSIPSLSSDRTIIYGAIAPNLSVVNTTFNVDSTISASGSTSIPTTYAVYDTMRTLESSLTSTINTKVSSISSLAPDSSVIYGATYTTSGPSNIAYNVISSTLTSAIILTNPQDIPTALSVFNTMSNKLDKPSTIGATDRLCGYGGILSGAVQQWYNVDTTSQSFNITSDDTKIPTSGLVYKYINKADQLSIATSNNNCYASNILYDATSKILAFEGSLEMNFQSATNLGSINEFGFILENISTNTQYYLMAFPLVQCADIPGLSDITFTNMPQTIVQYKNHEINSTTYHWKVYAATYLAGIPTGLYKIGLCKSGVYTITNFLKDSLGMPRWYGVGSANPSPNNPLIIS